MANAAEKITEYEYRIMFGHFELPNFFMNALVEMPDHGGLKAEDLNKP